MNIKIDFKKIAGKWTLALVEKSDKSPKVKLLLELSKRLSEIVDGLLKFVEEIYKYMKKGDGFLDEELVVNEEIIEKYGEHFLELSSEDKQKMVINIVKYHFNHFKGEIELEWPLIEEKGFVSEIQEFIQKIESRAEERDNVFIKEVILEVINEEINNIENMKKFNKNNKRLEFLYNLSEKFYVILKEILEEIECDSEEEYYDIVDSAFVKFTFVRNKILLEIMNEIMPNIQEEMVLEEIKDVIKKVAEIKNIDGLKKYFNTLLQEVLLYLENETTQLLLEAREKDIEEKIKSIKIEVMSTYK